MKKYSKEIEALLNVRPDLRKMQEGLDAQLDALPESERLPKIIAMFMENVERLNKEFDLLEIAVNNVKEQIDEIQRDKSQN